MAVVVGGGARSAPPPKLSWCHARRAARHLKLGFNNYRGEGVFKKLVFKKQQGTFGTHGRLFRTEESSVRKSLSYGRLFRTEESSVRKTLPYGRLFRTEESSVGPEGTLLFLKYEFLKDPLPPVVIETQLEVARCTPRMTPA